MIRKYIPTIKIVKKNNKQYDQLQLCKCGEIYAEHYNKDSYCNFEPIYLKGNFRELFLDFLENNNFEETIDYVFNYSDLQFEEMIVKIIAGDYPFYEFSYNDFDNTNLTTYEIIQFSNTLIDIHEEEIKGKYRRHKINKRKLS